jgi:hypothetical protein
MYLQMWMLFLWALSFTDIAVTILAEDATTLVDSHGKCASAIVPFSHNFTI